MNQGGKVEGGVLEFDIKKILKIKFYLEIEGMFVDSYAY